MASNFTRARAARNLGGTKDISIFLRSASIAGQKTGQVEIGVLIILDRESASRSARSQFCDPVERLKAWLEVVMAKRHAKLTLKRLNLFLKFIFLDHWLTNMFGLSAKGFSDQKLSFFCLSTSIIFFSFFSGSLFESRCPFNEA